VPLFGTTSNPFDRLNDDFRLKLALNFLRSLFHNTLLLEILVAVQISGRPVVRLKFK